MSRRPALPLALLAALLAAAPASAATAGGPPRIVLRLPSPGHVTVAALSLDVSTKHRQALPRRVSLGALKLGALPPSVKLLFATRSLPTRRGRRYAAVVFVVRRASARRAAAPLARGARTPAHAPDLADLAFIGGRGPWVPCRGCDGAPPRVRLADGVCGRCGFRAQVAAIRDADRQRPRRLGALADLAARDFGAIGSDPTLTLGQRDDGRAFRWGAPRRAALTSADLLGAERALVADLAARRPGRLVPDLERATAVDLDGDGKIGRA
ncbi:MAG: hypothetical protein JSS99_10070 [Actinobacteria bacterium]|nr:hypothetical protein [Actinomycetota bacterium]